MTRPANGRFAAKMGLSPSRPLNGSRYSARSCIRRAVLARRNRSAGGGQATGQRRQVRAGLNQRPGDDRRAERAERGLLDASDRAVGDVGDDLRRDPTGGGRAGHRQPLDGHARRGQMAQMPSQFAGKPLDHRANEVARAVRKRDSRELARPVARRACRLRRGSTAARSAVRRCPAKPTRSPRRSLPARRTPCPSNAIAHSKADPPLVIDSICPNKPGTGWGQTNVCGVAGGASRAELATSTQAVPVPRLTSPSPTEPAPSDAAYWS